MWNHSCEQFSSCRAFQLNQKTENQRSIYQTNVESFLRTVLCRAFQFNQKNKKSTAYVPIRDTNFSFNMFCRNLLEHAGCKGYLRI